MPATTKHQANHSPTDDAIELLFGAQFREIDASSDQLEKQLARQLATARDEMCTRTRSLDRSTQATIDSLSHSIDRADGTAGNPAAETALNEIEKRLANMQQEFDRQYEIAHKDLEDRISKASDTTLQLHQSMQQDIADFKTSLRSRDELAGMFTELGKRLEANLEWSEKAKRS